MKKLASILSLLVSFFLFESFYSQNQKIEILSFRIYGKSDLDFPIFLKNSDDENILTIDFEVDCIFYPELALVFKLCDNDWNPYPANRIAGGYKNVYGPLKLRNLPLYARRAKYYFKETFPEDSKVEFPFSGKWKVFISDYGDTSKIYTEKKFIVAENKQIISVKITPTRSSDLSLNPPEMQRTLKIETFFRLIKEFVPNRISHVEIIRNREFDNRIVLTKKNGEYEEFYTDGDRRFRFIAKNVKPRNAYRSVDFRDANMFIGPDIIFSKDGLDVSEFYKLRKFDNRGASVLLDPLNKDADYLNVLFKLRADEFSGKKIYLTGSFVGWEIRADLEMEEKKGLFEKNILLKRGRYDYQYVVEEKNNGIIKLDWEALEGNFWEAPAEYRIFVYYFEPTNFNAPRIIGYLKINYEGL